MQWFKNKKPVIFNLCYVLKHYNNNNISEKKFCIQNIRRIYRREDTKISSIKRTKSSSRQHIATHSESKFLMKSTISQTLIKSTFFRLSYFFSRLATKMSAEWGGRQMFSKKRWIFFLAYEVIGQLVTLWVLQTWV